MSLASFPPGCQPNTTNRVIVVNCRVLCLYTQRVCIFFLNHGRWCVQTAWSDTDSLESLVMAVLLSSPCPSPHRTYPSALQTPQPACHSQHTPCSPLFSLLFLFNSSSCSGFLNTLLSIQGESVQPSSAVLCRKSSLSSGSFLSTMSSSPSSYSAFSQCWQSTVTGLTC